MRGQVRHDRRGRPVRLDVGDELDARVVAVRHGGELVLDVSGTRVVARAGGVLLAPGTVQRFLVVANDPVLLLRPNGAALPWDALPGVGPVRLANLLRSLDADTPGCGFPADRTAGESTAALRAWHLGLGHDLEARAVRLAIACRGAPPPAGTVAALRHTVKARALAVLANPGSRANAAAELVRLLNAIERDEARGAPRQVPRWLPLCGGGVGEARVLVSPPGGDAAPVEAAPAPAVAALATHVVLLCDEPPLGPVRVDLAVDGETVELRLRVLDPRSAADLVARSAELAARMSVHGLRAVIRVELAGGGIPTADLLGPTARMDLHA